MKVAYLECFAGIAGDMFLGALVDSGVDPKLLQDAADSLGLGVQLEFKKVDRSGIQATKARVLLHGVDAEEAAGTGSHVHSHIVTAGSGDGQNFTHEHTHTHTDASGHTHTHTHSHAHTHATDSTEAHSHVHGRSLSEILRLIETAAIPAGAKSIAASAFQRLGAAEAKIHGMPIEDVHFHEVGAVDAIIDIVCGAAGANSLGVDAWYCSSINTGSGFVDCAHGRFPVPAPATLELLRGAPVYAEGPVKEMTTPTGAALIQALQCSFSPMAAMRSDATGYGAGTRNPERFPNVVRLRVGVVEEQQKKHQAGEAAQEETVILLACAIDDATPEVLGAAAQMLLEHGALDVMQQAATMKKGRLGTLLTVMCRPQDADHLRHLLFRETSTLGVRTRAEQRTVLSRQMIGVVTEFGSIRLKCGRHGDEMLNIAPEFEDCRAAARTHAVPVKLVMQAAIAAYYAGQTEPTIQEHAAERIF